MAAGDVFQGRFSRAKAAGTQAINGLLGGTTYSYLKITALTDILIGNNTIDPDGTGTTAGYRLNAGQSIEMSNEGATAGLIDGAKITIRGIFDAPAQLSSCWMLAIANV